ncbi:MAG: DNRLRE domain-containing protein [Candidatus Levybacteria bacterium]|nr:DNRLRE domain-containing protein [Candidatus Levybacteria bacterium]
MTNTEKFSNTGFESNLTGWTVSGTTNDLTLQPDGATGIDTWILSVGTGGSAGYQNTNNGAQNVFQVGLTVSGTDIERGLIKLDLSSIPSTAKVSSATLSIYATSQVASGNAQTFSVYRMLQSWVEGTGNFSTTGDGTTWLTYNGVSNWQTAGGSGSNDRETTAIGSSAFASSETSGEFKNFSLTASAVQEWIDGTMTNNGVMIKSEETGTNRFTFAASDNATAANRPKLAISYYNYSRDTSIKYGGSNASAQIITPSGGTNNFLQTVNVGDTNTYNLVSYAYTDGSAITSSDVELFYNGSTIATTYTSVGSGWYKLTGTLTGANASRVYGVQVKANKTVYVDNFSLNNYASSGTLTSSIFDSEFTAGAAWGTLTYTATTPTNTTVSVKMRTSNSSSMSGATAFGSCTAITSGSDISSNTCVADGQRYIQYLLTLSNSSTEVTPTFSDLSLTFATYDTDAPSISLTALTPDPNSDNTPTLSGTATDLIGTVSNVQFQMDATSGSWTACTADDGSFDEVTETFTCTPSALSDGSHTMYVRATDSNSNTTASGSESSDTFTIDVTAPASFDLDSPGHESYTTNERPTFKWKATTDPSAGSGQVPSGLSSYTLEVDNGDTGDFSITGIPTSRTTDYDTNKYLVHYDNFSDSDSSNNYISIYTKSHSDWSSSENYGKLKEGSRSWKIKAIDAAGNERSEGRTVIVDLTGPTLSSLSSSGSAGSKDGYFLVTNQKPSLTGTITDNYSPDKVEISIYKENYFLGAITSKELFTSITYSLSNSSNNKSLSFSIPVPDSLDFGSYEVNIKGQDKAGNKSGASTIYFKVLTARQAKELLQGKLSEKEKKTIQERSQVSLPELEKKAVLRREKEAAEFDKLITPFSQTFSVIPNLIGNLYKSSTAGLTMTGNAISHGFLEVTNGIGKGYNNLAQKAPGLVKNTMLALENGVNTVSSTISNTNQVALNTLNKSQGKLENKISKSSRETAQIFNSQLSNVKNIAGGTTKVIASASEAISNSLARSQEETQKQIAKTHQNTSDAIKDKGQRISKGINLAFRSFQKPVNDTTGFLDRTKVWFLTFGSIVIDPNPTTISGVAIDELGKDYAVVSWKTNHYAWGKVNYGKDLTYGKEVLLTKREKVHVARLTGLKPGEKYYFEVMSQNKNYAYDAYYSFETKK